MNTKPKLPLNQLIKQYRIEKGLTQVELADLANVSQSLISNLEKDKEKSVTFGTVLTLSKVLGFTLNDICLDDQNLDLIK